MFSRYGVRVFLCKGIQEAGLTYDNKRLPSGTCFDVMDLKDGSRLLNAPVAMF